MEFIVPILGGITALLAGYAAYKRILIAGEDSASRRWAELSDQLADRIKVLEKKRKESDVLQDNQEKEIRTLKHENFKYRLRLEDIEEDHRSLAEAHRSLTEEHEAMKGRFARMTGILKQYSRGIKALIEQLLSHDIEPVWRPDNGTEEEED